MDFRDGLHLTILWEQSVDEKQAGSSGFCNKWIHVDGEDDGESVLCSQEKQVRRLGYFSVLLYY